MPVKRYVKIGVPASVRDMNLAGSKPSLAAAKLKFPAVSVFAFNEPNVEKRAPIVIIIPPAVPKNLVAASENGAEESISSFAGTINAIAKLTKI